MNENKMMKYWYVKVPKIISKNGGILLYADSFEVIDGDLVLKDKESKPIFSFSKGNWILIYAASCIDGGAIHVKHWD